MTISKAFATGIWDYDIDADILLCDPRWHDLLRLEIGAVRQLQDFRRYIHPDDVAIATAIDLARVGDMIARDEPYHNDFRVVRADGETRRWRSVACLLIDPSSRHRRAVGCVTDITDEEPKDRSFSGESLRDDALDRIAAAPVHLTPRELECLRWVSVGKTAWETATIIGRSRRTVEFHLINAGRKLGAINKIHAVVLTLRLGLI